MATKLEIAKQSINKLNNERKFWLALSSIIVITSFILFLKWDLIQTNHLQWIFVCSGVTVSIVWWYWTMRLIRIILNQRIDEVEILHDIVNDIKSIKDDVAKLNK